MFPRLRLGKHQDQSKKLTVLPSGPVIECMLFLFSQDEVNRTSIAAYIRTRKEIQMPFMSQDSPVRRSGLLLASLEIKTFACPHAKIRQDTGDVKRAAKSMAEETRI